LRYERKYRIEVANVESVRHEVLINPLGFSKSYADRQVNSIYYDDINFSSYNDNLLGIGDRVKYRVRWYGDNLKEIKEPIIEKKIKHNMLGRKEYFPIDDFTLGDKAPEINSKIPLLVNHLFPYVIVRYVRSYYESMDRKIRATIDHKLQYLNLNNGKLTPHSKSDDSVILEIKYNQGDEDLANLCMQSLPYRMTKNSKYVSAMKHYLT